MPRYIDAHCHCKDTPIIGAIINAAQISDWGGVIDMANNGAFGAIGIHPWYVSNLPTNWSEQLCDALVANPNLLVGEIGLDKHKPDMELQISIFEHQLDIAYKLNRGVCLHCVGAWDCVARILRKHQNKLPRFVLSHGFNGPIHQMQKFAESYNMFFSYGPRNINDVNRILNTPLPRILAETDSDDPSGVVDIVNCIADILNIDRAEMTDIIYNNANRMLTHG